MQMFRNSSPENPRQSLPTTYIASLQLGSYAACRLPGLLAQRGAADFLYDYDNRRPCGALTKTKNKRKLTPGEVAAELNALNEFKYHPSLSPFSGAAYFAK